MIKNISLNELKEITSEALVLQGCGGEVNEWVDSINNMFKKVEILLNNSKFENVYVFKNDNLSCIAFDMSDVELNIGKLAMWRIATHEQFGGTWLSDYLANNFEVEMNKEMEME